MERLIAIYMRVSSRQQDTRSQEPDLSRWADAYADAPVKWYTTKFTGKTMDRPGWRRLEADMIAGMVSKIVVWRLDRLGRTAAGLTALFEDPPAPQHRFRGASRQGGPLHRRRPPDGQRAGQCRGLRERNPFRTHPCRPSRRAGKRQALGRQSAKGRRIKVTTGAGPSHPAPEGRGREGRCHRPGHRPVASHDLQLAGRQRCHGLIPEVARLTTLSGEGCLNLFPPVREIALIEPGGATREQARHDAGPGR